MWQKNLDSLEWLKVEDKLLKSSFDYLKQEIETTRLYQVCLSGSSFVITKDLLDLYPILGYTQSYYWIISSQSSTYSSAYSMTWSKVITENNLDEYNKWLKDYGLTLKTKFAPNRILNDSSTNIKQVDLVTNVGLTAIGTEQPGLIINDILLREGHLILIKDQYKWVNLSNTIDANSYFTSSYEIAATGASSTTYSVWTEENGIYKYENTRLVRTELLDDYDDVYNISISSKLNKTPDGRSEQYHIERLKSGFFPEWKKGDALRFTPKRNYLLRNRVDYNNVYELIYNDIAKWSAQTFSTAGWTYSVPQRTIAIGEFGTIYLYQSGISQFVPNKWKVTLNEMTETSLHYWICGNRAHLLKVSKIDMSVEKVDLVGELHDLTSIQFIDDLNGIVVGKFNAIWMTSDGGKNWTSMKKKEFNAFSYTKVLWWKINKIFVAGEGGLFVEMSKENEKWISYKRMIVKDLDTEEPTENYLLVDDINDLAIATYNATTWPLQYSFLTQSSVKDEKEVLFIAANGNNLIVKDLNGFDSLFEFKFLSFTESNLDIKNITPIAASSSFYISADKVYKLNLQSFNSLKLTSNRIDSFATASIIHDVFANKLYNWDSQQLLIAGNNSLLKTTGFTESISDIDATFENRFKSKMLFLDYDIGSKLNFFDDQQQYRLPNSVGFTAGDLGNWLAVNSIGSEKNWLTYYKDFEKTFEYYTSFDTDNVVEFSSVFTYSANTYYYLTASNITGATADILPLAPNILSTDSPLIMASSSAITAATASKALFFSRKLIIFKKTTAYLVDVGDVMYISCDLVKARFVVNKIQTFSTDVYIYCYHDFEQGVINDILNYTGDIHIMNLNKFSGIEILDSTEIAYNNSPFEYPWNYDNNLNPDDYFAYAPWNNPELFGNLLFQFNIHPVAYGYRLSLSDGVYNVEPRLNNKTSYYNMRTKIQTQNITDYMQYTDKFLNFGYKPTYNLVDYLGNINSSVFTASKVFYAMPSYTYLPGNGGSGYSYSNIYFDTNPLAVDPWPKNKLLFGKDLYFEWNSIWKWTFVDVLMRNSGDLSERMFVMDKYFDEKLDGYVIEFHKELKWTNYANLISLDIISRRTLQQISDDLQVLNNIHRSSTTKKLRVPSYETDEFVNLTNELNFKFPTDSYAKIMLSDKDVKDYLTALIFTDLNNELCLNILNLEKQNIQKIISTTASNISGTKYLKLTTSDKHGLSVNDSVVLNFDGGTASSEWLNRSYFGYSLVKAVSDEWSFVTDKLFGATISGTDSGNMLTLIRDPYFNFTPVDLMEIGVDKVQKRAHLVEPGNVKLVGYTYSLVNIDFNKFRYELVDGLGLSDFYEKYPWVLEGNINEAIIGEDVNGLVWYKGTWECGRWFDGTWMSGNWLSGDWYDGTWNSMKVGGNRINPNLAILNMRTTPDNNLVDNTSSRWYGGRWFNGIWNGGSWFAGRLYDVTWRNGLWYNGIWNDGTWENGAFAGGVWINGTWNSGTFNSNIRPSYWIDGVWKGGDFENGIWYNGDFSSDINPSRFGTRAFNSRTAIWHGGKFRGSEFHSNLSVDFLGAPITSEYHKYSQWNSGIFSGSRWYGGLAMAINFNNSEWYGGIVEDIQVIGFNVFTQSTGKWATKITLNGIYYLNVMDEIWVNDAFETPFNYFGSRQNPGKYFVITADQIGNTTEILLDRSLNTQVSLIQDSQGVAITGATSISGEETGLRVTACFRQATWKSGVWSNGIFESGIFEGGIWYNGKFSATWGI